MIVSATAQEQAGFSVTYSDDSVLAVPEAPGNRHYQELMDWAALGNTISPYVAPPTPTPQQVSMRQARLALLQNGLLTQVESSIALMASPQKEAAQIEWEYAMAVERDNQLFASLATQLGLTETDLDNLFNLASTL